VVRLPHRHDPAPAGRRLGDPDGEVDRLRPGVHEQDPVERCERFRALVPATVRAMPKDRVEALRAGLRDLGYLEGKNIVIDFRWAEVVDRLRELAAELVRENVDVIFATSSTEVEVARQATTTIPIVFSTHFDPVGIGHVSSLARPGGNITGLSAEATDLEGKRLQLLGEVVTGLSHVAVMWNPLNRVFQEISIKRLNAAGETLRIRVQPVPVRVGEDLDAAFATLVKDKPHALIILADRVFLHNCARLMDFAAQNHLPGVYAYRELVEAGGLMSYGPSYEDLHRRAVFEERHVFARQEDERGLTSGQVLERWEALKQRERAAAGHGNDGVTVETTLSGVPKTLPSLLRAYEISARAAAVGFDWQQATDVLAKIDEEVAEVRHEIETGATGQLSRAEEEMGDLLFAIANLSRKLGIEPEAALRRANEKFTKRFDAMERSLAARGRALRDCSLDEMEAEWQRTKTANK